MKDKKKIEKFIELRAKGCTLDQMAKELDVNYEILAAWNKEYRYEIKNKKALMQEGMVEKYYLACDKKIELFGDILVILNAEVKKRDFADVPTEKLLEFIPKYHAVLKDVFYTPPSYMTSIEIEEDKNKTMQEEKLFSGILGNYK